MTITSKPTVFWAVAAIVGLLAAVPAEAGSIMLKSGATTLTITDQDFIANPGAPADMSGVPGVVAFVGSLGSWTFTLTTGTTKPAEGSPTDPFLELRDITLTSSAAAGAIEIWFSEVGFGPTGTTALSSIDGATTGQVTFETFKGTSLFSQATPLASVSFGPGAFSADRTTTLTDVGGPYSLTEKVTITHSGSVGATALKGTLSVGGVGATSVPDGGMTLSLLGLGLLGVAGMRRKLGRRN